MRQSPPSQAIHLVLVFLEERNIFKDSVQPSYRAESGGPVNLLFVHLSVSLPPPSLSLSRSLASRATIPFHSRPIRFFPFVTALDAPSTRRVPHPSFIFIYRHDATTILLLVFSARRLLLEERVINK